MTTPPNNVALDLSHCIRSQAEIGHTVTHNICTGETAVVPWGALDWLGFIGTGVGIAAIAGLICGFAWLLVAMIRDY